MTRILHIAHRGGRGLRPENTLPAFANAIRWGCDGTQLDVRLSKDNQVVVYSDDRLNRESCRSAQGWIAEDEQRPIAELTVEQLRQYDVGKLNPKSPNAAALPLLSAEPVARIPLLGEVIQLAKAESDSFFLVINLQSDLTRASERPWAPLLEAVVSTLLLQGFVHRAVLTSLDWGCLVQAKQALPEVHTWFATMPKRWLAEGDPPVSDLPPSPEYRARLRELDGSGSAPWYAAFHPRLHGNDVARAIRAAGGDGWLMHIDDFDLSRTVRANEHKLQVVVWSASRNEPELLHKALNAGAQAFCTDYPDVHPIGMTTDITPILERAQRAYDEKKWAEAARNYSFVIERFPRNAPLSAFVRLTITERTLKKYVEARLAINLGFQLYPRNTSLRIEDAALHMAQGNWSKALEVWKQVHKPRRLSALNYNRYAKTCEMLELWAPHQQIVEEGLAQFPDNKELAFRMAYNSAQRALCAREWQTAANEFARLEKPPGAWPSTVPYYARQAELELKLATAHSDEEKLACLETAHSIRTPCPEPVCLAGLGNALEIAERIAPPDPSLRDAILKLLHAVKNLEGDVRANRSPELGSVIAELAACTNEQSVSSLRLPPSYYRTLCQHLIRRGYLRPYALFRDRHVEALRRGRLAEDSSPHFDDFVSQVALANEDGDHDYFSVLQRVFERRFRDVEPARRVFWDMSALYHVKEPLAGRKLWPAEDEEFARYVAGKSIAMVGPVASDEGSGEEIDSYDLVVRFNHRPSLNYAPRTCGRRTDLSWYAAPVFASARGPDLVDGMNSLDFVMVNAWVWNKWALKGSVTTRYRKRFEVFAHNENPFLFGAPNAMQRVALDLLRFEVKRIKLFNANLFLSTDYMAGYEKGPRKNFFAAFSYHDPVANFACLKRLHEMGAVELDGVLRRVLSLTRKSYVDELVLRYGSG
jgi:glycerophosphoryl diester phosphodiesterase